MNLIESFANKQAVIGIVGLGYVGLPLMLRYNDIGFKVIGIDIDQKWVDLLNSGKSKIEHIPHEAIAKARASGFEATQISLVQASVMPYCFVFPRH